MIGLGGSGGAARLDQSAEAAPSASADGQSKHSTGTAAEPQESPPRTANVDRHVRPQRPTNKGGAGRMSRAAPPKRRHNQRRPDRSADRRPSTRAAVTEPPQPGPGSSLSGRRADTLGAAPISALSNCRPR